MLSKVDDEEMVVNIVYTLGGVQEWLKVRPKDCLGMGA